MMIIWSHGETKKKDSLIFLPGSDGITYYTVMPAAPFCLLSPTHEASGELSSFYERGRNSKFVFTSHEKRRSEDHKLNFFVSKCYVLLFFSAKSFSFSKCVFAEILLCKMDLILFLFCAFITESFFFIHHVFLMFPI